MTKRDPLLTADTIKPQLFNMDSFVDRLNAHAAKARLEQSADEARARCERYLRSINASERDVRGNEILQHGRTYSGSYMFVFTDNTYVCFAPADTDYSYGVEFTTPSIDEARQFKLLPDELYADLQRAEALYDDSVRYQQNTERMSDILQQAVEFFGKEKLKELIDGI